MEDVKWFFNVTISTAVWVLIFGGFGLSLIGMKMIYKKIYLNLTRTSDTVLLQLMQRALSEIALFALAISAISMFCFRASIASNEFKATSGPQLTRKLTVTSILFNIRGQYLAGTFGASIIVCYLVFLIVLLFVTKRNIEWLTINDIIKKHDNRSKSTAILCFIALRFIYLDAVENRIIKGLDDRFGWFATYSKNLLMSVTHQMVAIPITTTLTMIAIKGSIWYLKKEFIDELGLYVTFTMAATLIVLIITSIQLGIHVKKVMPSDLLAYCQLRFQLYNGVSEKESNEILNVIATLTPEFELTPNPPVMKEYILGFIPTRFIYGTTNPTKEDQLFLFKRNGILVYTKLIAFVVHLFVIQASILFTCKPIQKTSLIFHYRYALSLIQILLTIAAVYLFNDNIYKLFFLTLRLYTINPDILSATLVKSRKGLIQKVTYTSTSIKLQSIVTSALLKNNNTGLQAQADLGMSLDSLQAQADQLWNTLTLETRGTINRQNLYNYLLTLGIELPSEQCLDLIMITYGTPTFKQKKTNVELVEMILNGKKVKDIQLYEIHKEDFFDLAIILAKLLKKSTLDHDNLNSFFTFINIELDSYIGLVELNKIINACGLRSIWSETEKVHFLLFLSSYHVSNEVLTCANFIEIIEKIYKSATAIFFDKTNYLMS